MHLTEWLALAVIIEGIVLIGAGFFIILLVNENHELDEENGRLSFQAMSKYIGRK